MGATQSQPSPDDATARSVRLAAGHESYTPQELQQMNDVQFDHVENLHPYDRAILDDRKRRNDLETAQLNARLRAENWRKDAATTAWRWVKIPLVLLALPTLALLGGVAAGVTATWFALVMSVVIPVAAIAVCVYGGWATLHRDRLTRGTPDVDDHGDTPFDEFCKHVSVHEGRLNWLKLRYALFWLMVPYTGAVAPAVLALSGQPSWLGFSAFVWFVYGLGWMLAIDERKRRYASSPGPRPFHG